MKLQTPYLAFLTPSMQGYWYALLQAPRVEIWVLPSAFASVMHVGLVLSVLLGQIRLVVVYMVSTLLGCPFPCLLPRESTPLLAF